MSNMFWELYKKIKEETQTSKTIVLGKVILSESIFPKGILTTLEEAKIKHKGEVWIIRRTGEHAFPSNPHAHNYEYNCTMDLGTGDLYRKRELIGVTGKKEFLNFRELIQRQNIDLPPMAID